MSNNVSRECDWDGYTELQYSSTNCKIPYLTVTLNPLPRPKHMTGLNVHTLHHSAHPFKRWCSLLRQSAPATIAPNHASDHIKMALNLEKQLLFVSSPHHSTPATMHGTMAYFRSMERTIITQYDLLITRRGWEPNCLTPKTRWILLFILLACQYCCSPALS